MHKIYDHSHWEEEEEEEQYLKIAMGI